MTKSVTRLGLELFRSSSDRLTWSWTADATECGRAGAPDVRRSVRRAWFVDLEQNRLTLFGKPNDLGYDDSRELGYRDMFFLAALPEVRFSADPFLETRNTP